MSEDSKDSIQATRDPVSTTSRSPYKPSEKQEEFLLRDFDAYRERGMAGAFRAGLSAAAALCDGFSRQGLSLHRPSKAIVAVAMRARECGDVIYDFRDKCSPNADRGIESTGREED